MVVSNDGEELFLMASKPAQKAGLNIFI